jgi:type IX secretion system substrate protein
MKKLLLFFITATSYYAASAQSLTAGTMFPFYADITPDKLLTYTVTPYTHQTYAVNVFGDSLNDLEFTAHGAVSSGGSGAYINVTPLDTNVYISFGRWDSVFVPATSNWNITKVAKPLNAGEQLNTPGTIWDNSILYLTDHSGSGGGNKDVNDWIGGDKYLALKYQIGVSTWFGWIRLRCVSEDSCYVKDLSSTVASVGIATAAAVEISMYPNPVNDIFYITNSIDSWDISKLKFTDIYGKAVGFNCQQTADGLQIMLDESISNGCYLLNYYSENITITKKLIKISK